MVHKCFGIHCAKNTHAAFISIVVMWRAIRDIQENRIFTFKTMPAQLALRTATTVMGWTSHHPNEAQAFALQMRDLLKSCAHLTYGEPFGASTIRCALQKSIWVNGKSFYSAQVEAQHHLFSYNLWGIQCSRQLSRPTTVTTNQL